MLSFANETGLLWKKRKEKKMTTSNKYLLAATAIATVLAGSDALGVTPIEGIGYLRLPDTYGSTGTVAAIIPNAKAEAPDIEKWLDSSDQKPIMGVSVSDIQGIVIQEGIISSKNEDAYRSLISRFTDVSLDFTSSKDAKFLRGLMLHSGTTISVGGIWEPEAVTNFSQFMDANIDNISCIRIKTGNISKENADVFGAAMSRVKKLDMDFRIGDMQFRTVPSPSTAAVADLLKNVVVSEGTTVSIKVDNYEIGEGVLGFIERNKSNISSIIVDSSISNKLEIARTKAWRSRDYKESQHRHAFSGYPYRGADQLQNDVDRLERKVKNAEELESRIRQAVKEINDRNGVTADGATK